MKKQQISVSDLDLIEINEAFAAVGVASARALGLSADETDERVNVNGGAIALGHPIGASGARLVLTCALELKRRGGGTGVAALCGGGGQGDALIIIVPARRQFPLSGRALSLDRDDVRDVVVAVRLGNPRALGRLISWIENASPALPMIMKELARHRRRSRRRPDRCARGRQVDDSNRPRPRARARGERVGVLAVDPSSPFSGERS